MLNLRGGEAEQYLGGDCSLRVHSKKWGWVSDKKDLLLGRKVRLKSRLARSGLVRRSIKKRKGLEEKLFCVWKKLIQEKRGLERRRHRRRIGPTKGKSRRGEAIGKRSRTQGSFKKRGRTIFRKRGNLKGDVGSMFQLTGM